MKSFSLTAALSAVLVSLFPHFVLSQTTVSSQVPLTNGTTGVNQLGTTGGLTTPTQAGGVNQTGVTQNALPGVSQGNGQVAPPIVQINPIPATAGQTPATATPTVIVIQNSPSNASATSPQVTGRLSADTPSAPSIPTSQGTLDAPLLQATCAQDWGRAIRLVDQALAAAPRSQTGYRSQLLSYRGQLQNLLVNQVRVPDWTERCTRG